MTNQCCHVICSAHAFTSFAHTMPSLSAHTAHSSGCDIPICVCSPKPSAFCHLLTRMTRFFLPAGCNGLVANHHCRQQGGRVWRDGSNRRAVASPCRCHLPSTTVTTACAWYRHCSKANKTAVGTRTDSPSRRMAARGSSVGTWRRCSCGRCRDFIVCLPSLAATVS